MRKLVALLMIVGSLLAMVSVAAAEHNGTGIGVTSVRTGRK